MHLTDAYTETVLDARRLECVTVLVKYVCSCAGLAAENELQRVCLRH